VSGFALGIWIVTILGGAYLWSFTTGINRPESNARATRLPRSLLFIHPLLALTGLVLWIGYVVSDEPPFAWSALAVLLVGGGIGSFLAHRTLRDRPRAPLAAAAVTEPPSTPQEALAANDRRAEHQMPVPAIVLHGVLAVGTIVAVLVAALQA
jgi:drug/metabolite transporter (DMT)-like permease